ncbi:flagellar FliJ protein [Malonomonas rubra DSM 5091]|uniref:Flagellar FliJ protein n=1 Tax=Malonomonas rubra DSM 5091 TaxID=1122189 RepID=A0A1M6MDE1_MALRU|nr:flagellar export protein FliJ [Malonomonas rubra]SHJ81293.1 flagellar FliJ protein [Malonomonas rubra DSM 5091]
MAKKFKLQSVLNYRQLLENQAQQLLAASMQRKTELEEELQRQQQELMRQDAELKERQRDGLTIAEIDLFENGIQHCRRIIERLQQELNRLERQIVGERDELLAAARDRQVIEKLKEKQDAEYLQELNRKEREMLDEISLRNKGDLT